MYTSRLCGRFLAFFLLFITGSCVKDVDIDQAQDMVIPPTVAVSLAYFTLNSTHFVPQNSSGALMASDEVRFEFLDDDYIRNGLLRADYNFVLTNTFKQPVKSTFVFLTEDNVVMYRINIDVPAGIEASPSVINYTEIINRNEIDAIRESIKMYVILEIQPTSENMEGELQLKSKAFYKFEFE